MGAVPILHYLREPPPEVQIFHFLLCLLEKWGAWVVMQWGAWVVMQWGAWVVMQWGRSRFYTISNRPGL